MKTRFKNSINKFAPIFLMVMTMFILGFGCNTSRPAPDPLAGFHVSSLGNLDANKTITDDYKDYIQKLPPEERNYVGPVSYFEDGTGQHAVDVEVSLKGQNATRHYALFYDKENRRVRVVKYGYTKYQS